VDHDPYLDLNNRRDETTLIAIVILASVAVSSERSFALCRSLESVRIEALANRKRSFHVTIVIPALITDVNETCLYGCR
jgi:hypothetical protein